MNSSFSEIADTIKNAERILVASHIRPDGDALGSTIAFALWLKSIGKSVTAWNEDGVTQRYRYLPQYEIISIPDSVPRPFDVLVALDNSVKNRLGKVLQGVSSVEILINIDHHVSNELYGALNYVDPASPATGQIIYEFFKAIGAPLSPDMAANLFAAISTDTGSFQYPGTDVRTFDAAAALVAAGVDVGSFSRKMYDNQPRRRLDLLRHALNEARFSCDGHLASFSLSLAAVDQLGSCRKTTKVSSTTCVRSRESSRRSSLKSCRKAGFGSAPDRKTREWTSVKFAVPSAAAAIPWLPARVCAEPSHKWKKSFWKLSAMRSVTEIDGVLLVDKARGMTSHDVVAIARRALGTKKVGHCGTLDPL
ncbi:MAG TPA: DHH family phosphoesterase, partial [Terrimicrobiaceae bacterium]|nr:DHH family phosphoesterase [Terrimicrobiaceae bacterium]